VTTLILFFVTTVVSDMNSK